MSKVTLVEGAAPDTPAGGKASIFIDVADGKAKKKDSAGAVVDLEAGAAGGEANTVSNIGVGGVGLFKQKTPPNLEFKNINGSSSISITDDTGNDEVDVAVLPAGVDHNQLLNYDADQHGEMSRAASLGSAPSNPAYKWLDRGAGQGDQLFISMKGSNDLWGWVPMVEAP